MCWVIARQCRCHYAWKLRGDCTFRDLVNYSDERFLTFTSANIVGCLPIKYVACAESGVDSTDNGGAVGRFGGRQNLTRVSRVCRTATGKNYISITHQIIKGILAALSMIQTPRMIGKLNFRTHLIKIRLQIYGCQGQGNVIVTVIKPRIR
jgi:hypothetical protein